MCLFQCVCGGGEGECRIRENLRINVRKEKVKRLKGVCCDRHQ